jgi:hypothetical protein
MRSGERPGAITGEVVGGLVYVLSFSAGLSVLLPAAYLLLFNGLPGDARDILVWAMLAISLLYNVVLGVLAFRHGRHTWPLMLLNLAIFGLLMCGIFALSFQLVPD